MLVANSSFCKLRDAGGQVCPLTDAYPEPGLPPGSQWVLSSRVWR